MSKTESISIPPAPKKVKTPTVSIRQLFQYADGTDKILIAVGTIAAISVGIALPAFSELFGRMINTLVSDTNVPTKMQDLALWMFGLGAFVFITASIFSASFNISAARQTAAMRHRFFYSALNQETAFHDENKPAGLGSRLTGDTKVIRACIGDKLGLGIQNLAMFVGGFILGFIRSWELTLLMIAVLPLIAVIAAIVFSMMLNMSESSRSHFAKAGEVADEALSNVRTVQLFGREEAEASRFEAVLDAARWANTRKEFLSMSSVGALYAIVNGSYALMYWFSSYLIQWGRTDVGEVVTTVFALLMGCFGLGLAIPSISALADARGAAHRLFEICNRRSLFYEEEPKEPLPEPLRGRIEFRDMTFSYPTRKDMQLFSGLNLIIEEGTTVALSGASGCGKSSLIALVQRLYDPDEGSVLIDGVPLREIDLSWWRSQVGVVSQEPNLFSGSIRENILVGKPKATDEEIVEACKAANIHETVMGLPEQYNTPVGTVGSQLSGGQKQRLAIARVILKNPSLLILDEATSALDRKSEMEVLAALEKLLTLQQDRKRTVLFIAHRLATIHDVDCIYFVVHDDVTGSHIEERGTFDELVDLGGLFANMVSKQARIDPAVDSSDEEDMEVDGFSSFFKSSRLDTQVATYQPKDQSVTAVPPKEPLTLEETAKLEEKQAGKRSPTLRLAKMSTGRIGPFLLGLLGSTMSGANYPIMALAMSKMMGVLAYESPDEIRSDASFWAGILAALAVGVLIGFILQGFYGFVGEYLTVRLRKLLLRNVLRQDGAFFDTPGRGPAAIGSVLAGDCESVHLLWGPSIGLKMQMAANIVTGIIIAMIYAWKVGLVTMSTLPLVVIATGIQQLAMMQSSSTDKEEDVIVLESLSNIRTVFAFDLSETQYERYVHAVAEANRIESRKFVLGGIAYGASQFVIYAVFAGSMWYGSTVLGEYSFTDIMIALTSVLMGAMGAGEAAGFAAKGGAAVPAAKRVFALIDHVPTIDPMRKGSTRIDDARGVDIAFDRTSFIYPARPGIPVLRRFTHSIPEYSSLGLMGSTGCGKSTLIHLLCRFYDPSNGSIGINGESLQEISLPHWRRHLSLVSQEPSLFSGSVRENIRYSSPEADDDQIFEAARKAMIHDEVLAMPSGYNTDVGYLGRRLSGGQKQRVAIARGLLRKPMLLLLDEATSALDNATEAAVQQHINEHCRTNPMTVVSIAHRLTTIQHSDKIVLLESGRVLEEGTHEELMTLGGDYKHRFDLFDRAQH